MQLKKGDHVVIHTLAEADGEILECASDEFPYKQDGNTFNAVEIKGKPGVYNVDYLQLVKVDLFLKNMFRTNRTKPETVEMQEYIYNLLLDHKNGMYSKDIVRKLREEKDLVYSNTTTLMKKVMEKYPEIKKPYSGFYIIQKENNEEELQ